MSFVGDYALGQTVYVKFTTRRFSTGVPFTLAGTPAVAAYPNDSVTEITAGITLTVDFDARTGLNQVTVVATGANGYAAGTSYNLVITAGTVDAVSVVGEVVGSFTLERSAAFARLGAPAGASVSADIAGVQADTNDIQTRLPAALVGGRIDANMGAISADSVAADNLENAFDDTDGPVPWMGVVDQGTAQSATATTVVLRAASAFGDNTLIGATIAVHGSTQGYWQTRAITDNVIATDTVTVDTFDVTPAGTITYKIFAGAPASATNVPAVNVTQFGGVAGTFSGGRPEVNTTHAAGTVWGSGAITAASIAAAAMNGKGDWNVGKTGYSLTATTGLGNQTANITGNLSGSVGSVTGAVGSVTGMTASDVGAIKAKTDSLTYTIAGHVDANVQRINDVVITGNGQAGTEFGV